MEFTFQHISLGLLIVLTGLSAGLCFTWSNAITPGIGRLDDYGYLMSFQQMNRTILNPIFFIVFFGPFILGIINLFVFKNTSNSVVCLLGLAVLIYFLGIVLVTIMGNVPLNEMLDKPDLRTASQEKLTTLRNNFEVKWNQFHLIRTLSAIASFILLIMSLIQITKNNI
ncbi:anthrone oxygenase family protein [Thalassobellus citreus]|uniref:anthrone oxygenase family protein n=1 Tax=Thalassobellus citreus TaxID=3367752 RepID=UPI0037AA026F